MRMHLKPLLAVTSMIIFTGNYSSALASENTESVSQQMQVTLEVLKSCAFTTGDMGFAQHKSSETSAVTAQTTLDVTCSKGTAYKLTTANDTRELKPKDNASGAAPIPYTLYSDSAYSSPLSTTTALSGTGTGNTDSVTVYGRIDAGALKNAAAGEYADTVTLNLEY